MARPTIASRVLIKAAVLLMAALIILPALAATSSVVLAHGAKVAGVTQAQYSVRWWQWASRQPNGFKPYQDQTGAQCGVDQSGSVFFLAGTEGDGVVHRRCEVPAGKYVFMPVINMVYSNRPGWKSTCAGVTLSASANNDYLTLADVKVDGVPVKNIGSYRQRSPGCFDLFAGMPSMRDHYPAASDGFWLMIAPLPPGTHTISVQAAYANPDCNCPFGDMHQDFDYVLVVGGAPQSKTTLSRARQTTAQQTQPAGSPDAIPTTRTAM